MLVRLIFLHLAHTRTILCVPRKPVVTTYSPFYLSIRVAWHPQTYNVQPSRSIPHSSHSRGRCACRVTGLTFVSKHPGTVLAGIRLERYFVQGMLDVTSLHVSPHHRIAQGLWTVRLRLPLASEQARMTNAGVPKTPCALVTLHIAPNTNAKPHLNCEPKAPSSCTLYLLFRLRAPHSPLSNGAVEASCLASKQSIDLIFLGIYPPL
jgi:hypothetical protein